MEYMIFEQQIAKHLQFLRDAGLELTNLIIDSQDFIRSRTKGELGRGEYAYKTVSRTLDNGLMGLLTWCRCEGGEVYTCKTYGWPCNQVEKERFFSNMVPQIACQPVSKNIPVDSDREKINKFWELSSRHGISDYLQRKGVGAYRIRFRENQYGRVAVVPVVDVQDNLCGYQILNASGSKAFAKGMQLKGAFHRLTKLVDSTAIGIAESYITAATCLELVQMPMVTAFTSNNLENVAGALQKCYPKSPLIIFADNDAHLGENKGVINAVNALKRVNCGGLVLIPQFKNCPQGQEYSDWNDLVRESGRLEALVQMAEGLSQTKDDRIERFSIAVNELLNF